MKHYLGDGVYVHTNPEGLTLTTENGVEVTNQIHLEVQVYNNLVEYVRRNTMVSASGDIYAMEPRTAKGSLD